MTDESAGIGKPTGPLSAGNRGPTACRTCAVAKAKCVPQAGEQGSRKCTRCERLNKECTLQTPKPRAKGTKKSTRVARLEQKLDDITNLLTTTQSNTSNVDSTPSQVPLTPESNGRSQEASELGHSRIISTAPKHDYQKGISTSSLSMEDADALLRFYQSHMTAHFPFVVIPPNTTAAVLKERRPLLFKGIMMAASYRNVELQQAFGTEIREYIASTMFQRGERSFDHLQGLLIAIAWYHFHLGRSRQMTNFVHLALALTTDLEINKTGTAYDRHRAVVCGFNLFPDPAERGDQRSLEERRALLGCFYVTSILSVNVKHTDIMKFTRYMDDCCRVLLEKQEYPTDYFLVQLVKIQRIALCMQNTLPLDCLDPPSPLTSSIGMSLKAFESELEQLKASLPANIQSHLLFTLHYRIVRLFMYEIGFNPELSEQHISITYFPPVLSRPGILSACLDATRDLLQTILEIPHSDYFLMTYASWAQVAHAIIVLTKLCLSKIDGWDNIEAEKQINFLFLIDELIDRLQTAVRDAAIHPSPHGELDVFTRVIPQMRLLKQLYRAQRERMTGVIAPGSASNLGATPGIAGDTPGTYGMNMAGQAGVGATPGGLDPMGVPMMGAGSGSLFDFFDDAYWRETFTDFGSGVQ
ncbi:hypothetical protein P152DRAFT_495064 [Eremomyces bilateralis CBS 781.70]|uniref:Zn(2)-C6 fungal-type domain-containing protein n=1 Tax=Eremomyces bilateralis CBS 781.70 TaxID=1392243 RepID=A0A6G1FTR3_9PEZI|nr:uncharacterized protein P152DRAFT_495064 [Eremomyces bilateralis CBS 781.70]KAF1809130.1 hypothetical protein P152DRAFT_495064 [Eremomyces bilateralis CBS 781.70]